MKLSIVLMLLLSSCVQYKPTEVDFITRPELEALNARTQCRMLARNMLQLERCDTR
jgi:hypothetical protein